MNAPALGRCAAMAVPLGARVEVYGYERGGGLLGYDAATGRRFTGVVAAVHELPANFLNVKITFDDGSLVYTRAFAVATVLERTAS